MRDDSESPNGKRARVLVLFFLFRLEILLTLLAWINLLVYILNCDQQRVDKIHGIFHLYEKRRGNFFEKTRDEIHAYPEKCRSLMPVDKNYLRSVSAWMVIDYAGGGDYYFYFHQIHLALGGIIIKVISVIQNNLIVFWDCYIDWLLKQPVITRNYLSHVAKPCYLFRKFRMKPFQAEEQYFIKSQKFCLDWLSQWFWRVK